MKGTLLVLAIVLATSAAFGQTSNQDTQDAKRASITGCLTAAKHGYRLRDEKGVTNDVYSSTVKLDSYVGQSVTLIGAKSATPSTDTGTARPMPHFKVFEVQPAQGNCK